MIILVSGSRLQRALALHISLVLLVWGCPAVARPKGQGTPTSRELQPRVAFDEAQTPEASGPPLEGSPEQIQALERVLDSAVEQAGRPAIVLVMEPEEGDPPEPQVEEETEAPKEPGVDPPDGPEKAPEPGKPVWNTSLNYWIEMNGDTLLQDYFATASYGQLDIIFEHLVVPGDAWQRLRVHYGDFYLVKNEDAVVVFRPGGLIDTQGTGHYGGRLVINFPKANFSIVHNGYAGNKIDRHESFVEWKPHENLGMMYYRFADSSITPKSLLGPKLYFSDKAYIYYGMPLNSDKRSLLWVGGNFSF